MDNTFRQAMAVVEAVRFQCGDSFPVCPRCGTTLEREYQHFCDRCGQKLKWSAYSKAIITTRRSFGDSWTA